MQTELSEANRKLDENIEKINKLKHQVNKDTDINDKPNTVEVSINDDINIMRKNGNLSMNLLYRNLSVYIYR